MGKYLEVKSSQKRLHFDSKKKATQLWTGSKGRRQKIQKGKAVESFPEDFRFRTVDVTHSQFLAEPLSLSIKEKYDLVRTRGWGNSTVGSNHTLSAIQSRFFSLSVPLRPKTPFCGPKRANIAWTNI
jgi:hypothetical protein